MMKTFVTAAIAAMFLITPALASANACHDGTPHAHTVDVPMCSASRLSCEASCVCDRGYHAAGSLANGDPRCVRNRRGDTDGDGIVDIAPLVCAFGAVLNRRGTCECPEELGARNVLVPIFLVPARRRALGLPARGSAQTCIDPLATAGERNSLDGVLLAALDERTRIICGSDESATPEEVLADCRETRVLIDSIRNGAGSVTITYGDRTLTPQEAFDLIVGKIGEIEGRLTELEAWREETVDPTLVNHEERITALETGSNAWRDFLNATHLRLGGFGRLGFSTAGPATGAGGGNLELLFRFGSAPVGVFLRGEFGGQSTGYGIGGSLYLAGGVGLAIFTGGRRDTTIGLGFWAEDLLHPFADAPDAVQGSHLGVAVGVELSVSIPLPGDAYWVRIRPGIAFAHAERYYIGDNAQFSVISGAYIAPSLSIEFQPDL